SNDIITDDKTYIEVTYNTPQTFTFYNNESLALENVRYLVFCIENGNLWYGDNKDAITGFAYYNNTEHPYIMDEDLYTSIIER
ncbi:MAG: hypothetical protein K6G26_13015, partial [Lachnospiraceae bacterium]|nr:hypothetical protein [Lachnospiraceae bacterium]